jgi:hypothetical protein
MRLANAVPDPTANPIANLLLFSSSWASTSREAARAWLDDDGRDTEGWTVLMGLGGLKVVLENIK